MAELLDLALIGGVGLGGLAYVYNFHGFKDLVNGWIGIDGGGPGPGCTKTCPAGQHITSSCTCVPNTGGGGGTGAGVGKDGVSFIYPTKPGGFTWYIGPNGFDSHLVKGGGSTFSKLVKNSDGSFTADASKGSARFNLNPPTNYESGGDAIGVCKMNYAQSVVRGYTWKPSDLHHVEFTGFFRIKSALTGGGIYMRGPCNHHPSEGKCCENANYDWEVHSDGRAIFTKQAPEIYQPDPAGFKSIGINNLVGHGWFGIKYIHAIMSKDPKNPKVMLQGFINLDGLGKNWTKIAETIDHNGYHWGNQGNLCGSPPDQVLAFGAPRMVFKWYTGNADFKKMSLREITVPGAASYYSQYIF